MFLARVLLRSWRMSDNSSCCSSAFRRSLQINLTLSKTPPWQQLTEPQQRLWEGRCRGLHRLPAPGCASTKPFGERIKKSLWKWVQIILRAQTDCSSSSCRMWGIWICLNIWLLGHHQLSDYSQWILCDKLQLQQFINFQIFPGVKVSLC